MSSNNNLNRAIKVKNDEFYTPIEGIEHEISAYLEYNKNLLNNKTVLLPCNDYNKNFHIYFRDKFDEFGIKKLIVTEYNKDGFGKVYIKTHEKEYVNELTGDGSFLSDEVTCYLMQSDYVFTNPPFSLFRDFIDWLYKNENIKFSIIGNLNAWAYKNIINKLINNTLWPGSGMQKKFIRPDGTAFRLCTSRWFTNIKYNSMPKQITLKTEKENLDSPISEKLKSLNYMKKYDNYDAIEIPMIKYIPSDYNGIMGVPVSFIDYYDNSKFEILGLLRPYIDGKAIYKRFAIKFK